MTDFPPHASTISVSKRALLLLGSLGPIGHFPASGTVAVALVGIPVFAFTRSWSPEVYGCFTVIFILLSVVVHEIGDRILKTKDSGQLVWDELAGFFVAICFVPFTWQLVVLAFLMERAFDISKFPPAGWIERRWPGGWGVVGDDVVAGLYTCGATHLLMTLLPNWVGMNR
ncbi:MAG: phosphatidylglycerophosphatase A [Planctomycetota bacterium]